MSILKGDLFWEGHRKSGDPDVTSEDYKILLGNPQSVQITQSTPRITQLPECYPESYPEYQGSRKLSRLRIFKHWIKLYVLKDIAGLFWWTWVATGSILFLISFYK